MSEENNIIPIGSIVKIKSLGDLALYVNYGVVDKYTSAGGYNLEHYDVLAIFKDQQQDSFCYYPRQIEIVHPEEVAPNLWNSVADKLDSYEKINLAHVILEQHSILESDNNLLHSFSWTDSKQGHDYWSNINKRINSKQIDSFIEEYNQPNNCTETTKIKSDGGSSDYYKLEINGNPVEVEEILTIVDDSNDAASILQQAKDCLVNRASERDKPNGERSMKSTVEAFNALTGHSLSESNGWLFMLCLKAARAEGGCFKADDYVDGAAYFALYGEAAAKEANNAN